MAARFLAMFTYALNVACSTCCLLGFHYSALVVLFDFDWMN
jgi:hypothetical protein